jgi:hypothetical protein
MKTIEQILTFEGGKGCSMIDGRDRTSLSVFLMPDQFERIGLKLAPGEEAADHKPKPFTEENVKAKLKGDLAFAFEKALGKRGITAGLMNEVIKMWLWVLDDPLANFNAYAEYGLPLLKLVAVKYGFENPIGDDQGNELKYSTYGRA